MRAQKRDANEALIVEAQEQALEDEGIRVVRSAAEALEACQKWL